MFQIKEYTLPHGWLPSEPFEIEMNPFAQFLSVIPETGVILVKEETGNTSIKRRFIAIPTGAKCAHYSHYLGYFTAADTTLALFALFTPKL